LFRSFNTNRRSVSEGNAYRCGDWATGKAGCVCRKEQRKVDFLALRVHDQILVSCYFFVFESLTLPECGGRVSQQRDRVRIHSGSLPERFCKNIQRLPCACLHVRKTGSRIEWIRIFVRPVMLVRKRPFSKTNLSEESGLSDFTSAILSLATLQGATD